MSYLLYRAYFEHQCANHPDLLHLNEQGRKVFEVMDIEEAISDFRGKIKEKDFIFRLLNYNYTVSDNGSTQDQKNFTGGFIIARYFDVRNTGKSSYYQAMESTEKLVDEFIEKIISDSREGHPLWNYSLDYRQDFNIQPRIALTPSYAGWSVVFRWSHPIRICITDPSAPAWLDGGTTPFEL